MMRVRTIAKFLNVPVGTFGIPDEHITCWWFGGVAIELPTVKENPDTFQIVDDGQLDFAELQLGKRYKDVQTGAVFVYGPDAPAFNYNHLFEPAEVKEPKMMICPSKDCNADCAHAYKHNKNHTCNEKYKLTCPPCVPYEEKAEPKESELEIIYNEFTKPHSSMGYLDAIKKILLYLIKKEKECK